MIVLFSPKVSRRVCRWVCKWLKPLVWVLFPLTIVSIVSTPADVTQGSVYRIIYFHVPMALASLSLFFMVTLMSSLSWVLHLKVARQLATISARVGVCCTAATLSSGAIWGMYTWGDWWVWDARLTTYLMLGLVYTAYIIMDNAVRSYKASEKALVVLGWVGFIDMVLVHYSVLWWQSLHQQSTLFNLGQHTMPWSMLGPLLLSMLCVAMAIVVYVSHSLSREMDWV